MQYTPNYNLITVEGTDIVNPLIQMNPNFTDIDAAMFANKQAVIGSATELTSGTVHSITRLNPDSNYFRFTATSNWNAGDSISVDGVAVSAFTPDGKTLSQGCYVINTEVFAILNGTRLTVFVDNALALSDLTDASINTPSDGEALVYENGSWSNKQLESSDISYGNGTVKTALDETTSSNFDSGIPLTAGVVYTPTAPGYIQIYIRPTTEIDLSILSAGSTNGVRFDVTTESSSEYHTIPVNKGMRILWSAATANNGTVAFYPLAQ